MKQLTSLLVGGLIVTSAIFTSCSDDDADQGGDLYVVPDEPARGGSSTETAEEPEQPADGRLFAFGDMQAAFPEEWEEETPASQMRALQMRVPGAEGAGDATLAVFTGIFGTVDQNIERWIGQFTNPDGGAVEPTIEELEIGEINASIVTLSGTFSGGMNPDDGGPDRTMIQAILSDPSSGGSVFVRLLGPTATVDAHREAFLNSIRSVTFR